MMDSDIFFVEGFNGIKDIKLLGKIFLYSFNYFSKII